MKAKQGLFIGELSRQVGIPTQTIRYYERLGLLNPPKRTESQYRVYLDEDTERLQFIQKAKRFGLSLDEIKKLIDISVSGALPCASLKEMVKKHLDELDCHIREMVAFHQELASHYERIDALLPDSLNPLNNGICDSRICWLIEREND
ncbi:heavy metal-responsive transcriptional regulator [Scytonema sp. PRP1]|uniref:heavy metal-responsive transcriptional regulator n=1 Tax=Scytonema sp. PRP1 TaxID=3120513 RepID=UPI00300C3C3E